jgi:TetR/AcrR family transcriptional repressor of nem operon
LHHVDEGFFARRLAGHDWSAIEVVEVFGNGDTFGDMRASVQLQHRHQPKLDAAAVKAWAFAVFPAVEGAQLVARGCDDVKVFDNTLAAYRTAGLLPGTQG